MLPLPFTVATGLLLIAFSMSKLQYQGTSIIIAIHAILGPFEIATLIWTFISFIQLNQQLEVQFILLLAALSLIVLLNILAIMIQTPLLLMDSRFKKWKQKKEEKEGCTLNAIWFYLVTILSLVTSYKFKMVLFSGLFNFDCLKCKLESVKKFKLFNVFCFLGLLPQILTLYCAIVLISSVSTSDSLFLLLLDTIIIFVLNIVFSLISAKKDDDFFQEELDGMPIYKVVNIGEQQFQSSNSIGCKSGILGLGALEDVIQLDQIGYMSTKRGGRISAKDRNESDSKKISECTEEQNTITNSQSSANLSESLAVVAVEQPSEAIIEQKVQTNILMIDQVYDFQTERPQEEQVLGQEQLRMTIEPERRLEETFSDEEIKKEEMGQHNESLEGIDEEKQVPTQRITLTAYLQSVQKQRLQSKPPQQTISKHDKIPSRQATQNKQHISISQQQQTPPELLPQPTSINLRLKSEPAVRQNISSSSLQFEAYQACSKLNKDIKQIMSIHNSPSKVIVSGRNKSNSRQTKFINRNKTAGNINVTINEDHDEKPILSKSREKLSIVNNSPIKDKDRTNHPLHSQRTGKEGESDQDGRKSSPRGHLMKRKIQTETQPEREQNKQTIDNQKRKDEQKNKFAAETKRKQTINVEIHNASCSSASEQKVQQFKRSQHQIINTLPDGFQNSEEEKKPREMPPMQPHIQSLSKSPHKRKPKKRIDTEISTTSFIKMFAPNSRKTPQKQRACSSVGRKRAKRQLSDFDNLKTEDRRRMRSLEKIYLQRQSKHIK